MPLLRLAYATEFLIALIAVFVSWSEVGGQVHLDIMPWYLKFLLGAGAAFAFVKATAAAVEAKNRWNARVLKWAGILLVLLFCCGLVTYYVHVYGESDEQDEEQDSPAAISAFSAPGRYSSVRFESALRLARSAPTSATTMRSRS